MKEPILKHQMCYEGTKYVMKELMHESLWPIGTGAQLEQPEQVPN